jgi:hypothetical protein
MALKLDDPKDHGKYRAAVQTAAKAVRASPAEGRIFEAFAFCGNKPGWPMPIGSDLTDSSLAEAQPRDCNRVQEQGLGRACATLAARRHA